MARKQVRLTSDHATRNEGKSKGREQEHDMGLGPCRSGFSQEPLHMLIPVRPRGHVDLGTGNWDMSATSLKASITVVEEKSFRVK